MSDQGPPVFTVGEVLLIRLRGLMHWYPAVILSIPRKREDEGIIMDEEGDEAATCEIMFTRQYRDLHLPPPPPPARRNVVRDETRSYSELKTLLSLFDSCGGPGWRRNMGWDRAKIAGLGADQRRYYEDPDSWEGVSIHLGRVSIINLGSNSLEGELAPSVYEQLPFLVELNLCT